MEAEPVKILLVEDNPGDVRLMQEALLASRPARFELTAAKSMAEALKAAAETRFAIILLDLCLPDTEGFDTFKKIKSDLPDIPVVVLTGLDDEDFAFKAVQAGAQDYLVKQYVNPHVVLRVIRYAIERHRLLEELKSLSLYDEMTGLYNRRGFYHLAQQQLKVANRMRKQMTLIYCDMDNLKKINDTFGHHEGSAALIETVAIMKKTVRDSDIVARLGGDEFVILLVDSTREAVSVITERLQKNLDAYNASPLCKFPLSISMGIREHDPENPCSLDELLISADKLMYEQKTRKKHSAG